MALIPNSPDTRGVLYELSALAEAPRLSTPLTMLFDHGKQEAAAPAPLSDTCVPAVLDISTEVSNTVSDPPGLNTKVDSSGSSPIGKRIRVWYSYIR